jgi:hypothetical protein
MAQCGDVDICIKNQISIYVADENLQKKVVEMLMHYSAGTAALFDNTECYHPARKEGMDRKKAPAGQLLLGLFLSAPAQPSLLCLPCPSLRLTVSLVRLWTLECPLCEQENSIKVILLN